MFLIVSFYLCLWFVVCVIKIRFCVNRLVLRKISNKESFDKVFVDSFVRIEKSKEEDNQLIHCLGSLPSNKRQLVIVNDGCDKCDVKWFFVLGAQLANWCLLQHYLYCPSEKQELLLSCFQSKATLALDKIFAFD